LRGFVKAGDLADELERGGADFFGRNGRIEIEEDFDVSAHGGLSLEQISERRLAKCV
jgi:hypothetical protein